MLTDKELIKWIKRQDHFLSSEIAILYAGYLPDSRENPMPRYPGNDVFEMDDLIRWEAHIGAFKPISIIDNREDKTLEVDLRDDNIGIVYSRKQIEEWFKIKGMECPEILKNHKIDKKKTPGRKVKTQEEMQQKLDEVKEIRKNNPQMTLTAACEKVGITPKTHQRYTQKIS